MVQLGADDTKLNMVSEDILDNFPCIGDLKGNDKRRVVLLKIAYEFGKEILSRKGARPQR